MLEKLKEKYTKNPIKGDIHSLQNLKLTLDDLVLEYLTKVKKLKQNTLLVDFQIVVGIISTVLASLVAYFSVNYEFLEYKKFLTVALIIYFSLNSILWIVNKLQVTTFRFQGMCVCTGIKSPSTIYTVIIYKDDKIIPQKYSKSVLELFDSTGILLHEVFFKDLENMFK